jgi:hypothetical protein
VNRRGFLGAILVAAVAPAIVRADSLMRIVPLDTLVVTENIEGSNGLFWGQLGRFDGLKIIVTDPAELARFARASRLAAAAPSLITRELMRA